MPLVIGIRQLLGTSAGPDEHHDFAVFQLNDAGFLRDDVGVVRHGFTGFPGLAAVVGIVAVERRFVLPFAVSPTDGAPPPSATARF